MKTIVIRVDGEVYKAVLLKAKNENCSMREAVRRLVLTEPKPGEIIKRGKLTEFWDKP